MKTQSYKPETQEISLRLEQYDDIFSDFDIRPYSRRALSIDFLDEVRRAARDKDGMGIELALHVPEAKRNESEEETIRTRLGAHFSKHCAMLAKERLGILKLGIAMVVLGIIFMIAATYIIFEDPAQNLLLSFLVVFLEPAAWFLLWEGMDQIIFNSKNLKPELEFYKKMTDARGRINFRSYTQ